MTNTYALCVYERCVCGINEIKETYRRFKTTIQNMTAMSIVRNHTTKTTTTKNNTTKTWSANERLMCACLFIIHYIRSYLSLLSSQRFTYKCVCLFVCYHDKVNVLAFCMLNVVDTFQHNQKQLKAHFSFHQHFVLVFNSIFVLHNLCVKTMKTSFSISLCRFSSLCVPM